MYESVDSFTVGVGVGEVFGLSVKVGFGVGVEVGLGTTLGVTSGAASEVSLFNIFPLLHTNFPFFLRHLNSLPLWVLMTPFLLQLDPSFGEFAENAGRDEKVRARIRPTKDFPMGKE
jgi:hypothetical protein